jgi:OPT family oligopeptide transporter
VAASPRETVAEFTFKAVLAGIVLGLVFGAANAYLGLRVGLTVSASIPAAVMTVAAFRLFKTRGTILEANLSQTIGSASTSLASGTIFTIPALFLWGVAPPYLQVVALCFLGGVLGLAAMIPLRRLLIVQEHATLPYPEGTACAEVLRATTGESTEGRWIFRGIAVGVLVKVLLALVFLVPNKLHAELAFLPKAELAIELAPALIAVGFILGYRQSGILVAGSVVSALVLTPLIAWIGESLAAPLFPETKNLVKDMSADQIWSRYVRYIGAGAVAVAGIIAVAKNLPGMIGAVKAVVRGVRGTQTFVRSNESSVRSNESSVPPNELSVPSSESSSASPAFVPGSAADRDLPGSFVIGAILVVILAAAFIPGVFAGDLSPVQRGVCALGVGIFGLLFVTVAARIVGIVGVSSQPTSGITLVTLLGIASIFAAMGWTDLGARAAVLTVGTIVAVAASKAGDISQDLKTGFLVGATPARQQLGQLIGAAFACWAVAGTVLLLGHTYTFGSAEIPAPQATLMKTIIEGVLAGDLPWDLVLSGGGLAIGASLCGVSALAFAIGVYLPLSSMAAIYLGGVIRALYEKRRGAAQAAHGDPGVLAASGLVAGEGLAGVAIAALVALEIVPGRHDPRLAGTAGSIGTSILFLAIAAFLYWSTQRSAKSKR